MAIQLSFCREKKEDTEFSTELFLMPMQVLCYGLMLLNSHAYIKFNPNIINYSVLKWN